MSGLPDEHAASREPGGPEERVVADFATALRQRVRLDRIILFGSWARGEATALSDIDLLVVSPDFGRDALADMVVRRQCLPPHEVDVDTIARNPAQIAAAEPDSFLRPFSRTAWSSTKPDPPRRAPRARVGPSRLPDSPPEHR